MYYIPTYNPPKIGSLQEVRRNAIPSQSSQHGSHRAQVYTKYTIIAVMTTYRALPRFFGGRHSESSSLKVACNAAVVRGQSGGGLNSRVRARLPRAFFGNLVPFASSTRCSVAGQRVMSCTIRWGVGDHFQTRSIVARTCSA